MSYRVSSRTIVTVVGFAVMMGTLHAQTLPRRATIRGGGDGNGGKCTIEVVVDGAAEVDVRGDNAMLRNLRGQPAQWRRFECSSPMPPNPANFRFKGIDGRGRQSLVRDPRQGGGAVVEIDDPDNGSEGYTFDLIWGGGSEPYVSGGGGDRGYGREERYRRFSAEQAVQVCQDAVRQQAADRFRTNEVRFRRTNIDDNPGRNDWVVGMVEIHRRDRPELVARFSCSVDFDNGRVRSANIEAADRDFEGERGQGPRASGAALENCQRAVEQRVRRDGYDRVNFGSVSVDNRPGRNDWVIGELRALGRRGPEELRFSCSVDLRSGDVRSVDVTRR
jgi:hypothetical protein